jgi:hypothetical protein
MVQLIPMMIALPLAGFWFWMFKDMTDNEYLSSDEKNNWMVWFILLNIFTAAWYYLVEFRNRNM